jgi:4-oxalocrotonate tautomerase
MPVVNIQMFEGRTVEQKRKLVADVTQTICDSLGVTPDRVRIMITDMPRENVAVAGVLNIDTVKK